MRSRLALTILFMLATGSAIAQDVNTEKGKLSYAVGWDIGADIKRRSTEFDVESVIAAIRDIVAETNLRSPNEDCATAQSSKCPPKPSPKDMVPRCWLGAG